MQLKDKNAWQECVRINDDAYGSGVVRFCERWATLMEEYLQHDMTIADMADKASHEADIEGITGFMYGCAVSILSQVWLHGEALRQWHNLKTQLGDEGVRANDQPGAVLNPALLNISPKEA